MQQSVDFDGTIIRYFVCAKSEGGDGHIVATTETLEWAMKDLKFRIRCQKKRKNKTDEKFWIVKQTNTFNIIYEESI